jgi:hypothetical protein
MTASPTRQPCRCVVDGRDHTVDDGYRATRDLVGLAWVLSRRLPPSFAERRACRCDVGGAFRVSEPDRERA